MSQPMIVWCTIAGLLLLAFLFRAIERYFTECHPNNSNKPRHLFEVGKDKDIFFVPGDIDEDDDFEDL
ncbi:unknown [Bacteroides sp. CAG:927]|nr:unknown [Bacteroides sp. CAG:927]